MRKLLFVYVVCLISLALTGCGEESGPGQITCDNLPPGKLLHECIDKSAPKADRIDAHNDPRLFGVDLEMIIADLPLSGAVEKMAWPGSYWPAVEDSVNNRWQGQGTYSALEKYDMAFNDWVPPPEFDRLIPFSRCGQEFDADYYDKLGPAAKYWSNHILYSNKAQRDAWDQPGCNSKIETWWGLCHAWTPAAMLEVEPKKAVTHNGVTFEVSDVKALFVMLYNNVSTEALGVRCNLGDAEIERDENGRIKQDWCRDTNPGSLHLILTNLIGRDKRAFAEDRTMGRQVWNQPVVGYQVDLLEEITREQALDLLDPERIVCTGGTYCYNEDAMKFYEVLIDVNYVVESTPSTEPKLPVIDRYIRTDTYHYVLECEDDGEIIGGEWISAQLTAFPDRISVPPNSQNNHSDFLWLPTGRVYTSNPHTNLENVRMLARMSQDPAPHPDADAKVFKSEQVVTIPDDDPAGASSVIEVTEDFDIGTLKVAVDITHPYAGDLTISLLHDGQEVNLQKNAGGCSEDVRRTFEVEGFGGSVRGTWELLVVDGGVRDEGAINSWELVVIAGDGNASDLETFSVDSPASIPDGEPGGLTSTIDVPGSGAVKSLKVVVDISHTWISDLRIELRHGTGVATLHNREGGNDNDIKKIYTVNVFNGADSGGTWDLVVVDNAGSDEGVVNSWALKIER